MNKLKRTVVAILACLTATLPLSSCNNLEDVFGNGHEHTWKNYIAKQPTCTQNGIMEKICEECGEKEYEDVLASGHNFINGACTVCGQKGSDGSTLTRVALPEGSNNFAKWSMEDIFDKVSATEFYPTWGYQKFLNELSNGNMQNFYLDSLNFLHFDLTWQMSESKGGDTMEAPIALAIGLVSPTNTTGTVFSNIYRVEVKDLELLLTYSDGVQISAGKLTSEDTSDVLIEGFGLNPDKELVVYYSDSTIAFAGKVAENSTAENQAGFVYRQIDGGYEVAGMLDENATSAEIPLTHRGKPITQVASIAFANMTKLKSMKIGANVTTLGSTPFLGCSALEWVVIPASVTSMNFDIVNTNPYVVGTTKFYFENTASHYGISSSSNMYFKGEWSYVNGVPTAN